MDDDGKQVSVNYGNVNVSGGENSEEFTAILPYSCFPTATMMAYECMNSERREHGNTICEMIRQFLATRAHISATCSKESSASIHPSIQWRSEMNS